MEQVLEGMPEPAPLRLLTHQGEAVVLAGEVGAVPLRGHRYRDAQVGDGGAD